MPKIIPKGYRHIREVLDWQGIQLFGDDWTGKEFEARKLPDQASDKPPGYFIPGQVSIFVPYEDDSLPDPDDKDYLIERQARDRCNQAEGELRRLLYDGKIRAKCLNRKDGTLIDIPSNYWLSGGLRSTFRFRLTIGTAEWKSGLRTISGPVLVPSAEFEDMCAGQPSSDDTPPREEDRVVQLASRRPRIGRPSMPAEIEIEMRQRGSDGKLLPSLNQEAAYLADWSKEHCSVAPAESTIRNNLRDLYPSLLEDMIARLAQDDS